jgi:hypothetical protein
MKRLLVLTTAVLTVSLAPPAGAGTYTVTACQGNPNDGATGNGSWVADMSDPFVSSYTACPGEGIVTRMSTGSGTAWNGASSRHTFTAPPGNRVIGIAADLKFNATRGWYAGFVDSSPSWIWCGPSCTSFGLYLHYSLGTNTQQLFAQVTCGRPEGCPRFASDGVLAMKNVTVTVADDIAPSVAITGGSVTQPGWHTGDQTVQFAASDSAGARFVRFYVNQAFVKEHGTACDDDRPRPCPDTSGTVTLPAEVFRSDSSHVVHAQAIDAAGNERWTSHRVLVDRTPPAQPQDVVVDGGGAWRATNTFSVSWRNPVQDASPIDGAHYVLCPAANDPGDSRGCVQRTQRVHGISQVDAFAVPSPGEWRLTLWLRDEVGNADRERSVSVGGLRFDDEVPTIGITPLDDDDPTRIRVLAADQVSGIAQGEIEVRRHGEEAWRSVPATLEKTGLSAVVDDEVMPKGTYDVRARVIDRAGNERSTTTQTDGQPAIRTLPLRVTTRLVVGKPTRVRARGADGKRRYRTVLRVRPRARFGRTIPLTGQLTMPGGNPLAASTVEVWERTALATAEWRRVSEVRTDGSGRFHFMALQGPSRTLKFRYPGTATIRARSTQVDLRVRAVTSFRASRSTVVNGEEVRFFGRLKGRQLGSTGKLIHLQVYTRGRWSTFATPRASRSTGRWSVPYRFTATRGVVRYRFRALVPREASFPYEAGASRSRTVKVRGL